MQDLTLVGVHDDGEHLVLAASDGQQFRVRVDEAMRAAVRRDRPRLGQIQIEQAGRLRPRDIQARIRAGETAEEIAESSGLQIQYVQRYEGPVLAEREFVVRQARGVRLRGARGGADEAPTLDDVVTQRLATREVDPQTVAWDAWRVEDGTWVVTLTFTAADRERRARWGYDAQLRQVSPQDDEARWLTDDEPAPSPGAATHRRLVPLRSADASATATDAHVYDVAEDGSVRPTWPAAATVDLLETLRERRGRRQRPVIDHDHFDGDLDDDLDDDLDTASSGPSGPGRGERFGRPTRDDLGQLHPDDTDTPAALPPAAHPPASRPELARDAEFLELPDTPPRGIDLTRAGSTPVETANSAAGPAAGAEPAPATSTPVPGGRRSKRASVPSWDDIVFGSRRE